MGLQPRLVLMLLVVAGCQIEREAVQRGLRGLQHVFGVLMRCGAGVQLCLRGADSDAAGVPVSGLGVQAG